MTVSSEAQTKYDGVTVDAAIFERWPDYHLLAMLVSGIDATAANPAGDSPLDRAEAEIRARGQVDWTQHPHVAAWMEAYADFGAKPKRTMPSVLALMKRVDAGLPRIDPLTDLYNAISIKYVLPIGGEDFDRYAGSPRLVIANGSEPFDTIANGETIIDHPATGEVIWRDDDAVTCRRWNWRQGVRTRITPNTTTALFLLEALGAMSDQELLAAGDELAAGLRQLHPAATIASRHLRAS